MQQDPGSLVSSVVVPVKRAAVDRRQRYDGPPAGMADRRVGPRRATDAIKMACPFCGASESTVVKSRGLIASDAVRRRRECATCGERFPTSEGVDREQLDRELRAQGRVIPGSDSIN
jgi:5-methylcytosine-specific restriction endonuclease McrA